MARPLRFQYPGSLYHVMARGDGGKTVFVTAAACLGRWAEEKLGGIASSCSGIFTVRVFMDHGGHYLFRGMQGDV